MNDNNLETLLLFSYWIIDWVNLVKNKKALLQWAIELLNHKYFQTYPCVDFLFPLGTGEVQALKVPVALLASATDLKELMTAPLDSLHKTFSQTEIF